MALEHSSVIQTSIRAYFSVFCLRRKLVFQYQNSLFPYHNNFDMQLQTYNIIPRNAPIFEACGNLDLPRVQELFRTRSASPTDICTFYDGTDFSLINEVFRGLVRFSMDADFASVMQGLDLVRFLLQVYQRNLEILNYEQFAIMLVGLMGNTYNRTVSALVEVVRKILIQSEEIPFELADLRFAYLFITLDTLDSPLSKMLLEQGYRGIETRELQTDIFEYEFWENDRLMPLDPEGRNMEAAIRTGRQYSFCFTRGIDLTKCPLFDFIDDEIFGLLEIAHLSKNPNIVYCCRTRLPILIQEDYDVNDGDKMLSRAIVRTAHGYAWISLVEYVLQLKMRDFFADILAQAGWSQNTINDMRDKELYTGIPELLDGQVEYQTQGSLRKKFMLDLIDEKFLNVSPDDMFCVSFQHSLNIGTDHPLLERVIRQANSSLMQKLTPGSWNDDGEVRLVPGVDFNPFIWNNNLSEKMDMRDWLALEDG